jgi:hypothetical protein
MPRLLLSPLCSLQPEAPCRTRLPYALLQQCCCLLAGLHSVHVAHVADSCL